ncbi:MAG: immunoglobulin-like domain-containing protein [Spirochaetota bacterium]
MTKKMGLKVWLPSALLVLLSACPSAPAGDTAMTADKAIAALSFADFGFPSGTKDAVTSSFTVPLSKNGASLSWSSDSTYITRIDQLGAVGKVFVAIPDTIVEGTAVSLTVTATASARATTTASMAFSVKLHAISDPATAVDAVAAGFTPDLLPLSGADSASSLTGSFTLPVTGSYGTEVSWVSDNSAITVNAAGKAIVSTQATGVTPTPVTLTPTVKKKGTASKTGTPITVTVPPITAQEAVTKDVIAITPEICTFGSTSTDTPESITGNFALPTTGDRGTVLTWTSSNPTVASPNNTTGTVTVAPATADTTITLTATIAKGGVTDTKAFTLTVKVATVAATYTVTFDSTHGDHIASITANKGTAITLPTPTGSGYEFLRWMNQDGAKAAGESYQPDQNTSMSAEWEEKPLVDTTTGFAVALDVGSGSTDAVAFEGKLYFVYSQKTSAAPRVAVYDPLTNSPSLVGGTSFPTPEGVVNSKGRNKLFIRSATEMYVVSDVNDTGWTSHRQYIYSYNGTMWTWKYTLDGDSATYAGLKTTKDVAVQMLSGASPAPSYFYFLSINSTSGDAVVNRIDIPGVSFTAVGGESVATGMASGFVDNGLYVQDTTHIWAAVANGTSSVFKYLFGLQWLALGVQFDHGSSATSCIVRGYGATPYRVTNPGSANYFYRKDGTMLSTAQYDSIYTVAAGNASSIFLNSDGTHIYRAYQTEFSLKMEYYNGNTSDLQGTWAVKQSREMSFSSTGATQTRGGAFLETQTLVLGNLYTDKYLYFLTDKTTNGLTDLVLVRVLYK